MKWLTELWSPESTKGDGCCYVAAQSRLLASFVVYCLMSRREYGVAMKCRHLLYVVSHHQQRHIVCGHGIAAYWRVMTENTALVRNVLSAQVSATLLRVIG